MRPSVLVKERDGKGLSSSKFKTILNKALY